MSNCATCGKDLRADNRSGYCYKHHHHKGEPPGEKFCRCGKKLSYRNTTGRCAKCNTAWLNSDPEMRKRRHEGLVESHGRPETRAKIAAAARKSWLRPEVREKRLAKFDPLKFWPAGLARAHTPEAQAKRSRSVSEAWMGWCPPEYRDEARRLARMSKKSRTEVQAIIAAKVEQDRLKPLRTHAPDAAEFLARHDRCPVMRIDDETWRYGTARKPVDELLRMAERKGWRPAGMAA